MKDNEKITQDQMQVDAEKILNHINYTRHWLEKADDDYKNRRFGNGGVILGLARAELTAAWEEALQLKTQVFRKMPKKAKNMAGWKKSSAAGLMAAGFIMAFMVIQYGNKTITHRNVPETTTVVLTEQMPLSAAPAVKDAPAAAPSAPVEVVAPAVSESAVRGEAKRHAAPQARRTAAHRPAATPAVKTVTPAPVAVVTPQPVVKTVEIVKVIEAPQPAAVKPRPHLDGIDLYKTADDALKR